MMNSRPSQSVAEAARRVNKRMAYLLAKPAHVDLDGVALDLGPEFEQRVLDLRFRNDRAGMLGQFVEQRPFARRQVQYPTADGGNASALVDAERPDFNQRVRVAGVAPAYGGNACDQFIEIERLHEVVVGTRIESADARRQLIHGRQNDHRHAVTAFAKTLQKFESTAVRQVQVQQYD